MEYFLGAVVALLVQISKKKLGTSKNGTLILVLIISLVSAIVYYLLGLSPKLLETIVKILSVAGAVHNYIIRQFEEPQNTVAITR